MRRRSVSETDRRSTAYVDLLYQGENNFVIKQVKGSELSYQSDQTDQYAPTLMHHYDRVFGFSRVIVRSFSP